MSKEIINIAVGCVMSSFLDVPTIQNTVKTLREMETEIERLQSENKELKAKETILDGTYIDIKTHYRDIEKIKSENTRLKADFNKLLSKVRGYCRICKHIKNAPIGEHCRDCNKVIKQNYKFQGLEVQND